MKGAVAFDSLSAVHLSWIKPKGPVTPGDHQTTNMKQRWRLYFVAYHGDSLVKMVG